MKSPRDLTYDGRQLCSARDPQKEAQAWCDLMLAPEGFATEGAPPPHYWVIGAGAGFHIQELAKRRSDSVISVIEWRQALVDSFAGWGGQMRGQVLLENVKTFDDLLQTKSFDIYGSQFSSVFRFVPCLQGSEAWAQKMEADLLGHSPEGFEKLSKRMNFPIVGLEGRIRLQPTINIKVIDSLFDGAPMSEEKKIVSLLRELVR